MGHSLLEDFPDPQCWLRLSALSYHLPPWSTLSPCLPLPRDRVLLGNRVCVLVTSTNSVPNTEQLCDTFYSLFLRLLCPRWVKQNKASRLMPLSLCIKGEPGGLWVCWQTRQDDGSVMEKKGKDRQVEGKDEEESRQQYGDQRPREAAVGAGCQTQQCPAQDSRFVCKTPRVLPWFPKGPIPVAPGTLPTLSLTVSFFFFQTMKGRGCIPLPDHIF